MRCEIRNLNISFHTRDTHFVPKKFVKMPDIGDRETKPRAKQPGNRTETNSLKQEAKEREATLSSR